MLQKWSPEAEFAFAVLTACEDQPALQKPTPAAAKAIIFAEQVITQEYRRENRQQHPGNKFTYLIQCKAAFLDPKLSA